jgi:DNA-binding NarL/FixJ family response regulator
MISVMVADDNPVVLMGLVALLETADDVKVVATAGDGRQAIDLARQLRPDLVLLDVRMPGMDGVETARRLLAADPDVVVVLISLGEGADVSSSAVPPGVAAHVRKQELSTRRLSDIWAAHGGGGR